MMTTPRLLNAIASADGEAMVLHPGDAPYIVTPKGRLQVSSRALSLQGLNELIGELLPAEVFSALEDSGAVQWELPPSPDQPEGRFVVVAAYFGRELWAEVRRFIAPTAAVPLGRTVHRESDDDLSVPGANELWGAPAFGRGQEDDLDLDELRPRARARAR